jgi:CheY-like chemotaxis protein
MRKDPAVRDVPVLIITGLREQIAFLFPGEPLHPHLVPVDELMEKPVEPQVLLEKIAALLSAAERRKAAGA